MSAVIHSVSAIRNSVLESNLSLREQAPTDRDEVRRSETVSESIESLITPLTARQMHAINLLAMGKTVVATARSLDIGVSTLHRWKATHPLFKAELGQRQHNLFDAMIQKLRLTMSKAVDNLFEMMNSNMKSERKDVTHAMLKLLRPQKFLVPSEPMSAEAVLDEAVREKRASRGESMSEEITDEERIAAIPAEFLVREEIKHQGHGGHEGNVGKEECGNCEEGATSRSRVDRRHVERGEASGASERDKTATSSAASARHASTPLPSRQGPGEGAAVDEVGANDERAGDAATANPRIEESAKRADAINAKLRNTSHAQLKPATAIAPRPLPQPLPRGEGSEDGASADLSVNPTSIAPPSSTPDQPDQILRAYAPDDGGRETRHAHRSGAAPCDNAADNDARTTTAHSAEGES